MTSSSSTVTNPYYRVNLWSRLFHGWISSLLKKSHKQGALHLNDLFELLPQLESNSLVDRLQSNWNDELKQTNHQPSLIRATVRTTGWRPFLLGLLLIPIVNESSPDGSIFHSNLFLLLRSGMWQIRPATSSHFPDGFFWIMFTDQSMASMVTCCGN